MRVNSRRYRLTALLLSGFLAIVGLASDQQTGGQSKSLQSAFERAVRTIQVSSETGAKVYRAQQPSQGLRSSMSEQGALTLEADGDYVGVAVKKFWASDRGVLGETKATVSADADGWSQITFARRGLSEKYVNERRGLHHWIQISNRPGNASSNLWVQLGLTGNVSVGAVTDNGVEVRTPKHVFTYSGLKAWDARGRSLRANFVSSGQDISIVVDDHSAKYPVTIDPVWTLQQKLTAPSVLNLETFGKAMAFGPNTALIISGGAVSTHPVMYFFSRVDGAWTFDQVVQPSDPTEGRTELLSCAMDGNTVIVGAIKRGTTNGAAFIFEKSGSIWGQTQTLIVSQSGGKFGSSVAINGDTAVVGTDAQSAAYVFQPTQGLWVQRAQLTDQGLIGSAVAIYRDEQTSGLGIFVNANNRVDYFENLQGSWQVTQTLVPEGLSANANFGSAISVDGKRALIGAPSDAGNGSAYLYERGETIWTKTLNVVPNTPTPGALFGSSVAISGTTLLIGATNGNSSIGAAYVFDFQQGLWTQTEILTPYDGQPRDSFGSAVGITTGSLFVAASNKSSSQGAAYVFATVLGQISLSFSPSTIESAGRTVGTLSLSHPAPPGGTTVRLQCSSAKFTVPATMLILPGQKTVSFPVYASVVTADTVANLEATSANWYSGGTSVHINSPGAALKSVSVADPVIAPGGATMGTVTLKTAAKNGGQSVVLFVDANGITVPQSVSIAGGKTQGTFPISAAQGKASYKGKITANDGHTHFSAPIAVSYPVIDKVTCTPTTIHAGLAARLVVTLKAKAPAGGVTILLTGSSPLVAPMPETMFIAAGAQAGQVSVQTFAGAALPAVVQISARFGADSAVLGRLTVTEPANVGLVLADTLIAVKRSTTATLTIATPAGADGTVVPIASSSQQVFVPSSVTIPSGRRSISFTVTSIGTDSTTSIISETSGGQTKTARLTVNRPIVNKVTISPSRLLSGKPGAFTISLIANAPAGGVTVNLHSSNSTLVLLPETLFIAAGTRQGNVVFTVGQAQQFTSVTLGANVNSDTPTSVTATVKP